MKFCHIADLHIGKKLNGISLLEDQKHALKQVLNICIKEKVDGLIIAGDVYQTTQPSNEAMMVFDDFLSKIVEKQIPVYMISGNHDSEEKIAYFSKLIQSSNVYANQLFQGTTQVIEIEDEYGKLNIHLLPFIKPIDVKHFYPEESVDTYQKAIEIVLKHSNIDETQRNILISHQFITGAVTSESEVFSIGTLDNINHDVFDMFDYVCLGHLHHPQRAGKDTIRYSGSLLKYSLSEVHSQKSVNMIDFKEKGNITSYQIPVSPLHELREIKGMFSEINQRPYSEDYISVTLQDEFVVPDAYLNLLALFPNMISYRVEKNNAVVEEITDLQVENKSVMDLFVDFYQTQNNGDKPNDDQLSLIERLLNELEEEAA